jgi:hypothetical protein
MRTVTVEELRIVSASVSGGDFSLSFPTATNRSYTVQRSPSLSLPNWTNLTTLSGNGATRSVTHTNVGASQQFYRVRLD